MGSLLKIIQYIILVFVVSMILSFFACSDKQQSKVVIVLFDISDSTKKEQIRKQYLEDFKTILDKINPGDVLVYDRITESSIVKSIPTAEEFEKLSFLESGPLKSKVLKKQHAEKKNIIINDVEKMLLKQNKVPYTDILTSLLIAEKVFKSYKKDKSILVIMSDMIEDSKDYNFSKDSLTEKQIEEIISIEKKKRGFPNLTNVKIYITGARADTSDRFFAIQKFWLRYFKECGADLSKENYGSKLLSFNE